MLKSLQILLFVSGLMVFGYGLYGMYFEVAPSAPEEVVEAQPEPLPVEEPVAIEEPQVEPATPEPEPQQAEVPPAQPPVQQEAQVEEPQEEEIIETPDWDVVGPAEVEGEPFLMDDDQIQFDPEDAPIPPDYLEESMSVYDPGEPRDRQTQ